MAARIPDAPTTVDNDGTDEAKTNPFKKAHFDRLREQGNIESSALGVARTPDAPKSDDTNGAETNPFYNSHFNRL